MQVGPDVSWFLGQQEEEGRGGKDHSYSREEAPVFPRYPPHGFTGVLQVRSHVKVKIIFLIVHSTLLQYIYEPAVPGGGSCCSIWQTSRPELLGVKWCPHIIAKKLAALGLPWCSAGEKSACNARNPGLIARSGRFPGEGISYPLQYSWAFLVAQMVKNLPAMQET